MVLKAYSVDSVGLSSDLIKQYVWPKWLGRHRWVVNKLKKAMVDMAG